MAKHVDTRMSGFKIDDLISKDGITFEIGEEYCDEDDEAYPPYTPLVQYGNEEMLDMLNMNDLEDDAEEDKSNEKESISLYGISFAKLKTKMTNLTPDGKVMKFIKQKGVGEVVPDNAQVTVHYIGYFEYRDEPFDSSYSCGNPRVLSLNEGNIIPGLHIGICSMQKHEIAIFLIHPDLAYKSFGCPPRIPPNEEVVFVVHLINYLDNGLADAYASLSLEEKEQFEYVEKSVKHMLVNAKDSFAKFNIKAAIRQYKQAIDCLENVQLKNAEEEEKMNQLLSKAYTNLGVCFNKLEMPRQACIACTRVSIPTAKSHYNFGKALLNLAEYNDAMKKLQNAYKLDPRNDTIRKLIQQTNMKQRQYLEIEKRLWKNCFKSNEDQPIKVSEFRKTVRDLCQTIIQSNDIMRQPLPEGFTEEEYEIIREEAAILGLDVLTSSRYNKNMMYLQKNKMCFLAKLIFRIRLLRLSMNRPTIHFEERFLEIFINPLSITPNDHVMLDNIFDQNFKADAMNYDLFTKDNKEQSVILNKGDVAQLRNSSFNPAWPIKIIIHGWIDNSDTFWEKIQAHTCSQVAEHVAGFLEFLSSEVRTSLDDVHIVGHSLEYCSHARSHRFFAESIVRPDGFVGVQCGSWTEFQLGKCNDNTSNITVMGEFISTGARGTFYLEINAQPPFGRGETQENGGEEAAAMAYIDNECRLDLTTCE